MAVIKGSKSSDLSKKIAMYKTLIKKYDITLVNENTLEFIYKDFLIRINNRNLHVATIKKLDSCKVTRVKFDSIDDLISLSQLYY
jgi:hypothetical protein